MKKVKKTTNKEGKGRKHTSISYKMDLYERLQTATDVLERSRNSIVNIAVKEYLDSYDIK